MSTLCTHTHTHTKITCTLCARTHVSWSAAMLKLNQSACTSSQCYSIYTQRVTSGCQMRSEKLFSRSRKQELPFSNGTVDIQNFQHWALVYFVPKYVGVVLWLDKGNFPKKICILCVCVKINVSLNLFVFGSRFRTLAVAVILFKISLPRYVSLTSKDTKPLV